MKEAKNCPFCDKKPEVRSLMPFHGYLRCSGHTEWLSPDDWNGRFTPPVESEECKHVTKSDTSASDYLCTICGEKYKPSDRDEEIEKDLKGCDLKNMTTKQLAIHLSVLGYSRRSKNEMLELDEKELPIANTGGYPKAEDLKVAVISINNFLRYGGSDLTKGLRLAKLKILEHDCSLIRSSERSGIIKNEIHDCLLDCYEHDNHYGHDIIDSDKATKAIMTLLESKGIS